MKLFMKAALLCLFVFGCTLLLVGCGSEDTPPAEGELDVDPVVTDWWSISDSAFFSQYKDLATGTQEDRSTFGWMLFARLNQPKTEPASSGSDTFSTWELWADNANTFPTSGAPAGPPTDRTGPNITASAKSQISGSNGEERTRNSDSWDYITDSNRKLYEKSVVEGILGTTDGKIVFPIGSIEIKAKWNPGATETDIYNITADNVTYGLIGLHIMAKIALDSDPAEDTSWFWTTFEYMGNPGYAHAMTLITPSARDALTQDSVQSLLGQAGLNESPWINYRLNGTQTDFVDGTTPIILGNTTMEDSFAFPQGSSPSEWTSWESSCHSCHYTARGNALELANCSVSCGQTPYPTGAVALKPLKSEPTKTIDFNWSVAIHAQK